MVLMTFFRPTFRRNDISFELDPNVDPSLRELVNRITPVCKNYSVVVRLSRQLLYRLVPLLSL